MITKTIEKEIFDPAAIGRGFFIFGKHSSWPAGVNGLVAHVTEEEILVQFLPDVRNVTNHYRISVSDIAQGEWNLRISENLTEMEEIKEEADSDSDGSDSQTA